MHAASAGGRAGAAPRKRRPLIPRTPLCPIHLSAPLPQARADAVAVDAFVSERASLVSSHAMMDEVANVAGAVMGSLRDQRSVLKGAHKRVLDIASTLGVSSSLMKIIERRTAGDRILVYGGSAVIVLLILLLWWFRRAP